MSLPNLEVYGTQLLKPSGIAAIYEWWLHVFVLISLETTELRSLLRKFFGPVAVQWRPRGFLFIALLVSLKLSIHVYICSFRLRNEFMPINCNVVTKWTVSQYGRTTILITSSTVNARYSPDQDLANNENVTCTVVAQVHYPHPCIQFRLVTMILKHCGEISVTLCKTNISGLNEDTTIVVACRYENYFNALAVVVHVVISKYK